MAVVLGLDTSNYTTSAAWLDGEKGDNAGKLLEVPEGALGLRQSDALFHNGDGILAGDHIAPEADTAAGRLHQTGDGAERGALARAVGADEGDDLALVDVEGDLLHGFDAAIVDLQVTNTQNGVAHSSVTPR